LIADFHVSLIYKLKSYMARCASPNSQAYKANNNSKAVQRPGHAMSAASADHQFKSKQLRRARRHLVTGLAQEASLAVLQKMAYLFKVLLSLLLGVPILG
jgi:hypothetical protein